MNEETPNVEEHVVSNIDSEEGSVTPQEVAEVMHIKVTSPEEPAAPVADDKPAEEEPDEKPTDQAPVVAPPAPAAPDPAKPEPVAPAETPSFALEVEDASGNKIVLNPGDDLEKALETFEPKSNGQIFQIIHDFMQKEADAKGFEAEQVTRQEQEAKEAKIAEIQTGWDKEVESLIASKRLTATADGKNERVDAVFKYMTEENSKRITEGRPTIQSFEDALDKLELREKSAAEADAAKKAKEETRKRGALVGGASSPATGSGAPAYVPRSANTANEALKVMGIL